MKRTLKKHLFVSVMLAMLTYSESGNAFTWATEWTQIANFIKLMDSGIKEGIMLENQAQAEITRINTLMDAEKNLVNAPADLIRSTLAVYKTQRQRTQQLLNDLNAMQTSYQQATQMLGSRMVEAQALGTNPQQYLEMEAQLAATKGGQYQTAYQRDTQTLQDVADKSASLENMMTQLPSQGNLEGLDKLNTLMAMVAGETVNLNRQFAQASAEHHAQQAYHTQQQQTDVAQQQRAALQWAQQQQAEQQQVSSSANTPSGYSQSQMEHKAWAAAITP